MVIPNVQIYFHAAKQELIYASINRMSNAADKVSLANHPNRICEKQKKKNNKIQRKSAQNRRIQETAFKSQVGMSQRMGTIFQQLNSQMGLLKISTN